MKLFIFDLETTGTRHWKNGIYQIAVMIVIDEKVIGTYEWKVKPYRDAIIEQEALDVAGVTLEQIMQYDSMEKVFKELTELLNEHCDKFNKTDKFHLVGFNNAGFDNNFLRAFFVQNAETKKAAEYGNYFGSYFWSDSHDVMVLASYYLKDVRHEMENFQLKTVAKKLGIKVDETQLHNAKYDLYLTQMIYIMVTK
jgi:DNA polymerase III subunit epsilon